MPPTELIETAPATQSAGNLPPVVPKEAEQTVLSKSSSETPKVVELDEEKKGKSRLVRPFAQLSGLAEADTPVRPVLLIGEEIREIDPIHLTVDVFDVVLGPVREANLLLPKRWDPLAGDVAKPLIPKLSDHEELEFKVSDQRRLLGSSMAVRHETPHDKSTWSWRATAGGSFRQGNTSNTNINSQFQAQRNSDLSDLSAKLGVNYNRNGDQNPNRKATGELVIDRNLRGRWVWYAREEAEYDQASLIDLRNVASTGLGFKFINKLNSRLVARTGPTVSYILYADEATVPEETKSGWLLESEFRHLIAETVRIEWTTTAFPEFDSEQQFRIRSDAAMIFPIGKASRWGWKVGVRHDYRLDPIGETRSTDIEGYFSLSFSK